MSTRLRAIAAAFALFSIGAAYASGARPVEIARGNPARLCQETVRCRSSGRGLPILPRNSSRRPNKETFQTRNPVMKVQAGRVAVDLYANDPAALQAALATSARRNVRAQGPLVSAQVPVRGAGRSRRAAFARVWRAGARHCRAWRSQGSVVSQGDVSLGSDTARATEASMAPALRWACSPTATGATLPAFVPGAPTSTAAQDVLTDDVPDDVQVLSNGPCPASDEGRAHGAARARCRAGRRAEIPHGVQRRPRLRQRHPAAAQRRGQCHCRRRDLLRGEHVLRRHHRAGRRPRRGERCGLFLLGRQRRAAVLRVGLSRDERRIWPVVET